MNKWIGSIVCLFLLTSCNMVQEESPITEKSSVEEHEQVTDQETEAPKDVTSDPKPEQEEILIDEPDESILSLEAQYFNQVEEVDGKLFITNADNILALVNKTFSLPSDYVPANLVRPDVPFAFGDLLLEKSYLREDAGRALEEMFQAASHEGLELYAVSGYRSYERQEAIFHAEVERVGEEQAAMSVAFPGMSEHQTGLAIDISSPNVNYILTEQFGETPEGLWLAEHAYEFGFILRYPKGKESITGYKYEPWHFRYVGKEIAKILYENNWTLEEYFEVVKPI
jgi:zinc D-Ala-D-Ala carboxypeptidase